MKTGMLIPFLVHTKGDQPKNQTAKRTQYSAGQLEYLDLYLYLQFYLKLVVLFTYIQYLCNLAKNLIKTDSHIAFQFTKRKIVVVCMKKTKAQEIRSSHLKGFA